MTDSPRYHAEAAASGLQQTPGQKDRPQRPASVHNPAKVALREAQSIADVDEVASARTAIDSAFADYAQAIAGKVIQRAMAGDMAAARLALDHLYPKAGEGAVLFKLRRIEKAEDASAAMADVMEALVQGEITFDEAERMLALVRDFVSTQDPAIFGKTYREAYDRKLALRQKRESAEEQEEKKRSAEERRRRLHLACEEAPNDMEYSKAYLRLIRDEE